MNKARLLAPDIGRYHRQMILSEIGVSGQENLRDARVLVVGAGGLGCPALLYLVAAGVGTIKIADPDVVDITNLHRQPLFGELDIGKPKVDVAARELGERNSRIKIIPLYSRVVCGNVRDLVGDVDIVIDGSDNFETKYLLNDACVELGKPLVSGSVFLFEGHLSVFNAQVGDRSFGPTYRCLFPEPPSANLIPSCAEAGVLGVIPGVIGTLQASEAIKVILGVGETLVGRVLVFDALSMSFSTFTFQRRKEVACQTKIQEPTYYEKLSASCGLTLKSITPAELKEKLGRKEEVVLIDVRERFEKDEFDIGGELIPSGSLKENVHRIPRDKTVVFYCRSGGRSERGVEELSHEFGFNNLVNLRGGILAWQNEVDGC